MSGTSSQTTQKVENSQSQNGSLGKLFLDLFVCLLIPTLILKKLSSTEMLGPSYAFALAISLPLMMALYEIVTQKKVGFVSALGFISILLTGGIGLLKLPKEYIAFKEALIPGVLAIACIISTYTSRPLIRTFVYNDIMLDTNKIALVLEQKKKSAEFEKIVVKATWILAGSFILSSLLNYVLAKMIIVSETGTEAFNSELGTMNLLSYPVIVLPCMVVMMYTFYFVITNITRLTELTLEEIVHE